MIDKFTFKMNSSNQRALDNYLAPNFIFHQRSKLRNKI